MTHPAVQPGQATRLSVPVSPSHSGTVPPLTFQAAYAKTVLDIADAITGSFTVWLGL
jgi:hypothetical protein